MTTTFAIRTDEKLKNDFNEFAKSIGTTASELVRMLMIKTLRERKIEFSGKTENGFTPEYEQYLLDIAKNNEVFEMGSKPEDITQFFEKNIYSQS
ncbi:MAG: type II toxin-antitoxin system RelB/DinJ family antitoxin [Patescibacteria group bacterium]|nr:type II toxin-antitoxin system RelB/DinJ family antitoxin [Patescibacteria group bacterium]